MTLLYPAAKPRGASAAAVARLSQHGQALAAKAADPDAAHAVGTDRPGLRPRDGARERQRPHHPAQGRAARRTHHRARPRARRGRPRRAEHAGRDLAGQCLRPLHPRRRPASGAARSEFHRRRPRADRRQGLLQVRHHQARRLSLGQPPQRLAAGAHPFLGVRPFLRLAPGDADVFPGRSAVPVRSDLQFGHRTRRRAMRMVSPFDLENTQPEWALCYRFDIVLRGRNATPMETK